MWCSLERMGMAYSSLSSTGKNSTPFSIFGAGGASIFSLKFSDTEGESFVTMGIPAHLIFLGHANVNGIFASNVSASFIFDCGTTLIVAPPPCASPPNVTFSPNKFRSSYAMSEASFNLGYLPSDSSRCVGAVVSQNVGLGTSWILGLAFLKNWVTVHDMGYNRFGFGTIRTT
ncbi:aspartic-type endopeptidase [Pseudohyphozyma bogoriensis]|nr:aspartic-type endopeptidase [Pseudohyphozyma bogoriensis]